MSGIKYRIGTEYRTGDGGTATLVCIDKKSECGPYLFLHHDRAEPNLILWHNTAGWPTAGDETHCANYAIVGEYGPMSESELSARAIAIASLCAQSASNLDWAVRSIIALAKQYTSK